MSAERRDPAAIRDATDQILQRPEFSTGKHGLQKVIYYITHPQEALSNAWGWVLDLLPWGPTQNLLIGWLVVAGVVGCVVYLIIRFGRSTIKDPKIHLSISPLIHTQSESELLKEAEDFEQRQEWKLALRARYGALIAHLAEAGIVRRQAGKTTGEYVREVNKNSPGISDSFREATGIFEWSWYGNQPTNQSDVERFCSVAKSSSLKTGHVVA